MSRQVKITKPLRRMIGMFLCFLIMFVMLCIHAFADVATEAELQITQKITSGAREIYNIFVAIILPICTVFVAAIAFSIFFGGEKELSTVKQRMFVVLLAIVLVYLAPVIVKQMSGWFRSSGVLW